MKRHWLLLLFPVALIGVLLAVKHFAGNRAAKEAPPTETVALKKLEAASNAPKDEVPKADSAAEKHLAPEIVEKMSTTMETYIKNNPKAADIADAYYNLGNLYYEAGQYEKAIGPLQKAVAQRPYDSDAHYTLGNTYDKLKRYPEAAKEFELMTKIEPKNDSVFYNLGNAYSNLKQDQKAGDQYLQALSLNPKNAAAHYALGLVYNRQRKVREAGEEFQQAVNLDPNNAEARYFLAMAKFVTGDRQGAMAQYDDLKRLSPKYADDLNKKMNP